MRRFGNGELAGGGAVYHADMANRHARILPLATLALLACLCPGLAWAQPAITIPDATPAEAISLPAALSGDSLIEQLTDNLASAQDEVAALEARIGELQAQIDEIEAALPAQQERSDEAMRMRYLIQSNPLVVADSLIESEDLGEFLRHVEYLERISKSNLRELNRLKDMKAQLDAAKAEQEELKNQAVERMQAAEDALRAEQDRRAERQREGVASARSQAGFMGGDASVGVAGDGSEQPEEVREAATTDTSGLNDGADWYADRDAFIAEWGERLNAYLSGSALAGQGQNFAASAWKYGIDPRWSAAISNTESGKGAACIRPYNAWGWGAADADPYGLASEWSSWESAIDAHAKGLSEGYGYTISMSGAKSYCPLNWQLWYNQTLGEMARI